MAGGIFLNYRREDSASDTRLLFTHLKPHFGVEKLFVDVDHITAGADFVNVLDAQVSQCDVMLSIIGPHWLTITDNETGLRRLDNPDDFVRIEIEAALERDILIIPVLVDNGSFPRATDLPETLQPLTRRNFIRLSHERYGGDCQSLINDLKKALEQAEAERTQLEQQRLAEEQQTRTAQDEELRRQEDQARQSAHAGLSSEEIRKAEELANWKFVDNAPTESLLRDHLRRFPKGTTKMMARTTLDRLVWRRVSEKPEREPLEGYLFEFPKGEKAIEARTFLKTIIEREDSIRQQQEHLARKEAAQKEKEEKRAAEIERLRREEEAEWHEIISISGFAGTSKIDELKTFIKKWPRGTYAKEAKKRLSAAKREYRELTGGGVFSFLSHIPPVISAFMLGSFLAIAGKFIADFLGLRGGILFNDAVYVSAALAGMISGLALWFWTDLSWKRVVLGSVISALGWGVSVILYFFMFRTFEDFAYQQEPTFQFLLGVFSAGGLLLGPLIVFRDARQINIRESSIIFACLLASGLVHAFSWYALTGFGWLYDMFDNPSESPLYQFLTNIHFLLILLFAPLMAFVALLCTPKDSIISDAASATAYASEMPAFAHPDRGPLRNFFARFPTWPVALLMGGLLGGILFAVIDLKNPGAFSALALFVTPCIMVGLILLFWTDLTIKRVICGAALSLLCFIATFFLLDSLMKAFVIELTTETNFLIGVTLVGGLLLGPLIVHPNTRRLDGPQLIWGLACLVMGGIIAVIFAKLINTGNVSIMNKFFLGAMTYAPLMACLSLFSTPNPTREFRVSKYDY